jgi:hypothetical protein
VCFAVLTPDGRLAIRVAAGQASNTEWGPYQEELWAAVRAEVDPYGGAINGIPLLSGMRAKLADAAMADTASERYPPNPVASVVLTSLSSPPRAWHGTAAIVGTENERGLTSSLTTHQLELINRAYHLATEEAGTAQ